jgi:hypothetical protein
MVLLLWILASAVVAYLGRRRRIGFWGFFFVSLILTPAVGLVVLLVGAPGREQVQPQPRVIVRRPHVAAASHSPAPDVDDGPSRPLWRSLAWLGGTWLAIVVIGTGLYTAASAYVSGGLPGGGAGDETFIAGLKRSLGAASFQSLPTANATNDFLIVGIDLLIRVAVLIFVVLGLVRLVIRAQHAGGQKASSMESRQRLDELQALVERQQAELEALRRSAVVVETPVEAPVTDSTPAA